MRPTPLQITDQTSRLKTQKGSMHAPVPPPVITTTLPWTSKRDAWTRDITIGEGRYEEEAGTIMADASETRSYIPENGDRDQM